VLGRIIEAHGPFRPRLRPPGFETLARSIVYQQLSGKVAAAIFARLEAAAGTPLRPEALLALSGEDLRGVGLSRQKAAYLRDLAEQTRSGALDFPSLPGLSDADVIERLTRVKGVGVWTAQMFLIFALGRLDVLPSGDLGVRAAIRKAYRLKELPTPGQVERRGAKWRPYCSVASWYLWRSLDNEAAL